MTSRISPDQDDTLKSQAKALFTAETTNLLALVNQLFSSDEAFKLQRSEARQIFCIAQVEYPNCIVVDLLTHLQTSDQRTTTFHCAILLSYLFRPHYNLYYRLSPIAQNKLKTVLLDRISEEKSRTTFKVLLNLISDVGQLLLPKREWPELYDYMFQSLEYTVDRDRLCAALLFAKLIPRCPEVFLFHIDDLCVAFMGVLDGNMPNDEVRAAAVGASVELVLHLAMPCKHDKYSILLDLMVIVVTDSVNAAGPSITERILEDMVVLAGAETRFLRPGIALLVDEMLSMLEINCISDKARELVLEFITTVAEDREYGCGMIQNIPPIHLKRLFTVLLDMLASIEDDPDWNEENSDDESEGESSECSYARDTISRLVTALQESVIMRSLPDCLPIYLEHSHWKKRHGAITALGLIADGCSKVSLGISETLLKIFVKLSVDDHPRVRWATIHAIGQFSKNWGPHYVEDFYGIFLPHLLAVMEDFGNFRLQYIATSTMLLFSKNCNSDTFNPSLKRILDILCIFLQKGNNTLKQVALTSLASFADSLQEFEDIYDVVMCYLKVNFAFVLSSPLIAAKTLACMTHIGVAIGKKRFMIYSDEVIRSLILLQASYSERNDPHDPIRCLVLQAWGSLCKCLGTEFLFYLSVCMPQLLKSVQLTNYLDICGDFDDTNDSDNESLVEVISGDRKIELRRYVLDEKAIACNVLCSFTADLVEEIHPWINEILGSFLPLLSFKFDDQVRMSAISAMPLLLKSASLAAQKGLLLEGYKTIIMLSDIIIPALLDALLKESKIKMHVKILEDLDKCIQICGSSLNQSIINQFIDCSVQVLLACSHRKVERKRRVEKGIDQREKGLLKEEMELDDNIYKAVADCFSTTIKNVMTSFLPTFDKLLPCLALMWGKNSIEERTIFLQFFRDVAKQFEEDALKYYEERLLSLLIDSDLENPDVLQIVAHGISICAEFGGNAFRPNLEVAVCTLECILKKPDARNRDNVVASEIAVVALGKICRFHCSGRNACKAINIWLSYLPLKNNLAEAKVVHEDLCRMIETSSEKVFGPCPGFNNLRKVMKILAEVIWAGENLASEETLNRMKKLVRMYQQRMMPSVWESISSSFPFPIQTMLNHSCFSQN